MLTLPQKCLAWIKGMASGSFCSRSLSSLISVLFFFLPFRTCSVSRSPRSRHEPVRKIYSRKQKEENPSGNPCQGFGTFLSRNSAQFLTSRKKKRKITAFFLVFQCNRESAPPPRSWPRPWPRPIPPLYLHQSIRRSCCGGERLVCKKLTELTETFWPLAC